MNGRTNMTKPGKEMCPKFGNPVQTSGIYLSSYKPNFCTGIIILQKMCCSFRMSFLFFVAYLQLLNVPNLEYGVRT